MNKDRIAEKLIQSFKLDNSKIWIDKPVDFIEEKDVTIKKLEITKHNDIIISFNALFKHRKMNGGGGSSGCCTNRAEDYMLKNGRRTIRTSHLENEYEETFIMTKIEWESCEPYKTELVRIREMKLRLILE